MHVRADCCSVYVHKRNPQLQLQAPVPAWGASDSNSRALHLATECHCACPFLTPNSRALALAAQQAWALAIAIAMGESTGNSPRQVIREPPQALIYNYNEIRHTWYSSELTRGGLDDFSQRTCQLHGDLSQHQISVQAVTGHLSISKVILSWYIMAAVLGNHKVGHKSLCKTATYRKPPRSQFPGRNSHAS